MIFFSVISSIYRTSCIKNLLSLLSDPKNFLCKKMFLLSCVETREKVAAIIDENIYIVFISVPDSWQFETETDPWIHALDYGSSFGYCTFRWWLSRCQKRFFSKLFSLLLSIDAFTSAFKDNKELTSHKTDEIKIFPTFFSCGSKSFTCAKQELLWFSHCKSGMAAGWILRHLCSFLGTLFFLLFYVQSIECFTEDQAFLRLYDSTPRPPSPVVKLSLFLSLPVFRGSRLLM